MRLSGLILIWLFLWWWVYYPGVNGGWQREGPYGERSYCESRVQKLRDAGIPARCVREG